MSALTDRITTRINDIRFAQWSTRAGTTVPKTEDVVLKNGAVKVDATYLYTDLRQSTLLAKRYDPTVTAKIVRMFLASACDVIRDKGGHIRSFDGDRVMGVFIGDGMADRAMRAATGINWVCDKIIAPILKEDLNVAGLESWYPSHGTGVDSGETFIARAGVRDNSDLISIGRAPNIAAKLSSMTEIPAVRMTAQVWWTMSPASRELIEKYMTSKSMDLGPYSMNVYYGGVIVQP